MRYLTLFLTCLLSMQAWALEYPEARRDNTPNTYHGITVADPFLMIVYCPVAVWNQINAEF